MVVGSNSDKAGRLMPVLAIILILMVFTGRLDAQYAPQAGEAGTTAMHKDSTDFIAWASSCTVDRGWKNINLPDSGFVGFGVDSDAIGKADNLILSLGDGGKATLFFDTPLADGPGWDFAVFENGFKAGTGTGSFLELAFVEVSSNDIDYVRFNASSLTQTDTQIETFDQLEASSLHNLAGKYWLYYGVPFDLNELSDREGLNIHHITSIRIIDVVGAIHPDVASVDSDGNRVNDPWPTPFESGGFDLDGIGVIHDQSNVEAVQITDAPIPQLYPNPARHRFWLKDLDQIERIEITNVQGCVLKRLAADGPLMSVDIGDLPAGVLLVRAYGKNQPLTFRLIKL